MVIDPVRKKYIDGVRALLCETLLLSKAEIAAQENEWIKRVEAGEFTVQNLTKNLRLRVNDGYKARIIAIVLAPENLTPFVWKEKIPAINIDKLAEHFSPRLKIYVLRLRELNASFDTTCV